MTAAPFALPRPPSEPWEPFLESHGFTVVDHRRGPADGAVWVVVARQKSDDRLLLRMAKSFAAFTVHDMGEAAELFAARGAP